MACHGGCGRHCRGLRGPHGSSREWLRSQLLEWERKKGQRCLLRLEHLHSPVVLLPELSPPDKTLSHFVVRAR